MEKTKTEAEKRKERRQRRKAAKALGISTKALKMKEANSPDEEYEFKPYDGISNRPIFSSLAFGKPKHIVMFENVHGFNHVMRLESNGHYMPLSKYKSDQSAELVKMERKR